ncbi:hypothetical protein AX17_006488 [Amanita inopinata Kibby_2008]|nr:hypothetical protein AX17_006488 [Amanita inopinata Kibby_2008]
MREIQKRRLDSEDVQDEAQVKSSSPRPKRRRLFVAGGVGDSDSEEAPQPQHQNSQSSVDNFDDDAKERPSSSTIIADTNVPLSLNGGRNIGRRRLGIRDVVLKRTRSRPPKIDEKAVVRGSSLPVEPTPTGSLSSSAVPSTPARVVPHISRLSSDTHQKSYFATVRGSPPDAKKMRTAHEVTNDETRADGPRSIASSASSSSALSSSSSLSSPSTLPSHLYVTQSGRYSGFANDSAHPIIFLEKKYRTATHLIEALRYMDHAPEFVERVRKCKNVKEVHKVSASFVWKGKLEKPQWAALFPGMVHSALSKKFAQHDDLRRMLLDTGHVPIIYQDHDTYFGDGMDGKGLNVLGQSLVRVRNLLREDGYS